MPNPKAVHPRAKCPECGNEFSAMYMPAHRRKAHSVKDAYKNAFKPHMASPKGRIPCPECGKTFAISYLQQHRRTTHGAYGGTSGVERRQVAIAKAESVAKAESSEVVEVPLNFGNGRVVYTETEFKVLVDSNGNLWLAEPIGR